MMISIMISFHPYIWIYYVLIIFIVGFFAFNLIVAVLKTYYALIVSTHNVIDIQEYQEPTLRVNLRYLKKIGVYSLLRTL